MKNLEYFQVNAIQIATQSQVQGGQAFQENVSGWSAIQAAENIAWAS